VGSDSNNNNQNVDWNTSPDGAGRYSDGPGPGSDNQPSHAPANGYNNNTPPNTPANAPANEDYTAWNWEQVLNGVLGMQLPDRWSIYNLPRWTATDSKDEGGSLFQIFGFSGGYTVVAGSVVVGGGDSFYVYLNPALQDPGGPWDAYYNEPVNHFANQVFALPQPNYTTIAVDPRGFFSASIAYEGAEDLYMTAAEYFNSTKSDLQSEASQYKGQAGEAFHNLVDNLFRSTQWISDQMGVSFHPRSYSASIGRAGADTATFVMGLWQAIGGWQEYLDHSPVGAIYQALLDGNVVSGSPGNYYIPNVLDAGSFGNLLRDDTWLKVENAAKGLWLNSIEQTLDKSAQSLINMLTDSYLSTAGRVRPVTAATLSQIGPPPGSGGLNGGDLNMPPFDINMPNINFGSPNFGGFNFGSPNFGNFNFGGFNFGGGGGGPNAFNFGNFDFGGLNGIGDGFKSLAGGLHDLGVGFGGGLNAIGGGLHNLFGPSGLGIPNGVGGLNGSGGGVGGLPGVGGGPGTGGGVLGGSPGNPTPGRLRAALNASNAEQKALEKALLLAPSTGPLHNALEQALADNAVVQGALRSALAGTTPVGTALQAALTGNGKVQSALNQALASGQVPKSGPLRTALDRASADNAHTRTALRNALGGAVPGGDFVHAALSDNGKVQSDLRHMLASGLIPRTGPLRDAITSALADSHKAQLALDQALASGGSPSLNSIQNALADNRAVQHELTTALASGQIPATGPLHDYLRAALAGSRNLSAALRQGLTSAGVPAEPVPIVPGLGLPAGQGLLGLPGGPGLHALLGGGGLGGAGAGGLGGVAGGPAFTGGLGKAGLTGPAGPAAASGLAGLAGGAPAAPVSSGRFTGPPGGTAQVAQAPAGTGTSAVPFYPPMAGAGMGMGGGQQGAQERERTTWLAEDEDVWGTAPTVGPASIGRDFADMDDDTDSYDDFAEPTARPRRAQFRQGT
jgi:hypothetical protein